MATPCPNCNKFPTLENGDPEVENLDVNWDGEGGFSVTGSVRLTRTCSDCSEAMKELNDNLEDSVSLKGFDWKKGNKPFEPDIEMVKKELNEGGGSVSIESGDGSVNEMGGGRYKKNMIEAVIPYTITISLPGDPGDDEVEGLYSSDIKLANPAGAYEECV